MGIINLLSRLSRSISGIEKKLSNNKHEPAKRYSQDDVQIIGQMAQRIVDVINESLDIANKSRNIGTKRSRLDLAKQKLQELKNFELKYPFLTITSLEDVERSIQKLTTELEQTGQRDNNVELDKIFDLCSFGAPTPAIFREERKYFRALIRKYKKEKETDKLKIVLDQYYNLAVLVTVCYGDHDCNSAVAGWQYDEAKIIVQKICNDIDFSFASHGYLEKSNFVSRNDWKTFKAVFGESEKNFDPVSAFRNISTKN